jgi:predicted nucleotidyltransferase
MTNAILGPRRSDSGRKLNALRDCVSAEADVIKQTKLAIYVTGSYGRLEASEFSDLDIFFIAAGSRDRDGLSHVEKTLLDAAIIRCARGLRFPEFTKGGVYLQVHHIGDVLKVLGTPNDDFENYFTARMLLLLESKPLYNENAYESHVNEIILSYWRDFHEHEKDFRPIFLVNDIVRFWKTMCLNYEARRNPGVSGEEKNKIHLKNLKLKYSRLLTCFSMIIAIYAERDVITPGRILELTRLTPLERLETVLAKRNELETVVASIRNRYARFLDVTGNDERSVLLWISDRDGRNAAFEEARTFGADVYRMLTSVASDMEALRFLLV